MVRRTRSAAVPLACRTQSPLRAHRGERDLWASVPSHLRRDLRVPSRSEIVNEPLVPGLPAADDLAVASVGQATWPSPLRQRDLDFVDDGHGVLCSSDTRNLTPYIE